MLSSLIIFSNFLTGADSLICYIDTVSNWQDPRYNGPCPPFTTKCYKTTYKNPQDYLVSEYGCDFSNAYCYDLPSGHCETQHSPPGVQRYTCCCEGDLCNTANLENISSTPENSSKMFQSLVIITLLLVGAIL